MNIALLAAALCLVCAAALAAVADERLARDALHERAEALLDAGPWSVRDNDLVPPGGTPNDYASYAPYWWPNPETADGLPYVRRDGELNRELRDQSDTAALHATIDAARVLSLAYAESGDERLAERAGVVLRHFFLDDATRMNPHLRFGQGVPGVTDGRRYGIIDTKDIGYALAASRRIEGTPAWSDADAEALRAWAEEYLTWLLTSDLGRSEAETLNNHGTYYDVQVAELALFAGRDDVAREVLTQAYERRIAEHVAADGSQPHELARTRSWDYVTMNLRGLMKLADAAEGLGIDLWQAPAADGGGGGGPLLKRALDALVPYLESDAVWPHEQIVAFDPSRLLEPLLRAQRAYGGYDEALSRLPASADLVVLEVARERTTHD